LNAWSSSEVDVERKNTRMSTSEDKSEDDLPGLAPKRRPLIDGLVLFQSGPTVKIAVD
jgi:hypothetical protein